MRLLVVRYEGRLRRFPSPRDGATVGSAGSNDLCLRYPGVSRCHARFREDQGGLWLVDLGSRNGLVSGGERLREVALVEGRIVRVGAAELAVLDASSSDLELALRFEVPAAEASTGVEAGDERDAPAPSGAAAALRFVRDLESCRRSPEEHLAAGRAVLGAESLVLLALSRTGEPSLLSVAGETPAEDVLEALARAAERSRGNVVPALSGRALVLAPRPSPAAAPLRSLAAVFARVVEAAGQDWQGSLLGILASRLLGPEVEAGDAIRPDTLAFPPQTVLGESAAMRALKVQLVAGVASGLDVLLLGETGTGKELMARAIHGSGPRSKGPFVAVNCAAIPEGLLEAELFGVAARVATGVDPRPGLFSRADGGTLFLDEVGELAGALQAKLLRVLQEREVLPLGASAPRRIDVQVVSASNRDLPGAVERGEFRADLLYRLRGLQVRVPPLRERREDIPALVLAFAQRACEAFGKRLHGVSRRALAVLCAHDWPGNVRELDGEIKRAVLACPEGEPLQAAHFAGLRARPAPPAPPEAAPGPGAPLRSRVDEVEREAIRAALAATRGNKTAAAKALGLTRSGLLLKMRRLGIAA